MKIYTRCNFIALFLYLFMLGVNANADVRNPERTQGLVTQAPTGDTELIFLKGRGKFISAQISKQGGTNDLTFVILDIDGKNVVNISIAALKNIGLAENNPYGLVLLQSKGNPKTFTIGFSTPLIFRKELRLSVDVQEQNVVQIVANVVHGK
ncbi:MAG: hypothetical protein V3U75_06100 [Methylococcaceae bacterium]